MAQHKDAELRNTLKVFDHIRQLPDELKLLILGYVLQLPNGIHSDRWQAVSNIMVKGLLTSTPEIARVVPEAFYKNNWLILRHAKGGGSAQVSYPKPAVNTFVQRLELKFYVHPNLHQRERWIRDDSICPKKRSFTEMINFLRRVSKGDIGFENLKVLRLTFKENPTRNEHGADTRTFIDDLLAQRPFTVRAKKLEVHIEDHEECTEDCPYWACKYDRRIRELITLSDHATVKTDKNSRKEVDESEEEARKVKKRRLE